MKFEKIDDVPEYRNKKDVEYEEAHQVAKEILPRLKDLVGSKKGLVFDLSDEGGEWPSAGEFRQYDAFRRNQIHQKVKLRMRFIIKHLTRLSLVEGKRDYKITTRYLGDAKVVMWWKYIRKAPKMS